MTNSELNSKMIGIINEIDKFCPFGELISGNARCSDDKCGKYNKCRELIAEWDEYHSILNGGQ